MRKVPEVNAGSMADIAFLLLIFFLVTAVIPNDQGINRKLSKYCETSEDCSINLQERNVLKIALNESQEILVNEKIETINAIKKLTKAFVDNNGDNSCNYCKGLNLSNASDNPQKAIVSIKVNAKTNYALFIKVQDELSKAYDELRNNYALKIFGKPFSVLKGDNLKEVKKAYPFTVSEAEIR